MKTEIQKTFSGHVSPFEQIRRTNDAGVEYWSSRDFAQVLQYNEYRNFEQVIQKARAACFNSGQRVEIIVQANLRRIQSTVMRLTFRTKNSHQ